MDRRAPPPATALIYGAGGHARELRAQLEMAAMGIVAFIDDFDHDRMVDGLPVLALAEASARFPGSPCHVGIGSGEARARLAPRVAQCGLHASSFVSPSARVLGTPEIREGVQVFAGSTISLGVSLGAHAVVNFGCILSHDVRIGAFATLSPGVRVAGHVDIGEGAFLGVGAVVRNGTAARPLRIGEGAVIGAGACVVGDVGPGATVAGNPARPLPGAERRNDDDGRDA